MDLDPHAVGQAAINLLAAADQLRHTSPRETLRYLHPESREGQYVVDLFSLSTDELKAKYGTPRVLQQPATPKRPPKEPGWGRLRKR